ncbi:MAG: hypothetical protein HYU02_02725 [Thaumarchaeota archaeon]|nr:hypothetical protein [Nitrososphaerota archaeon]
MQEAFKRAEPYLDLERFTLDETEKQRQAAMSKIAQLTPESLEQVLELLQKFMEVG